MSRTTRRRAVRAVAPVAGLLAAGLLVWQGSYAAFTATTTNQQDSWAAGKLILKNNGMGGNPRRLQAMTATPIINATNIVPGAATFVRVHHRGEQRHPRGHLKFYRGADHRREHPRAGVQPVRRDHRQGRRRCGHRPCRRSTRAAPPAPARSPSRSAYPILARDRALRAADVVRRCDDEHRRSPPEPGVWPTASPGRSRAPRTTTPTRPPRPRPT